MGNDASHHSSQVGTEGRATIKSEPSYPEEDRAENDMGDVVRAVRETVSVRVSRSLAQHNGISERCCSR